ncbi:MAG: diguanylate cyclase [Pirellulales bacterium]
MIVDGDSASRRKTSAHLAAAGFEVHEASDGVEAYHAILKEQHALVVSDWALCRMDGIELIRNLRTSTLNWYPYVVLLGPQGKPTTGMQLGADDFLEKPFDPEALVQRLQVGCRMIRLHETLRENNARLHHANEELAELAIKDVLSGLLNRRAFFEHAENEWKRSVRYDLPLTCLVMDIDHFKRINDTFGHPAGDSVICKVGEVLRHVFRETDILGRYGGEEFSVVLYDCDADAAALVAERLRCAIETLRMPVIERDFHFTMSLGLASRSSEVVNFDMLVDHADQALLTAKRTGRNRVARFDEIKHDTALLNEKPAEIISRG